MDIGITARVSSNSIDPSILAQRAEELGFESFWLPEHPILPVNTTTRYGGTADGSIPASMGDIGDPLIGLARASAVTNVIKLGTAISLVPEHNPLLHAKQIATLDRPFQRPLPVRHWRRLAAGRDRDHGGRLSAPLGPDPGTCTRNEAALDSGRGGVSRSLR